MLKENPDVQLDALAEAADAYVRSAFGVPLDIASLTPTALPHFILDRYRFWEGHLHGIRLILVAIREPRQGATADYLKHRETVARHFGVRLVLLLLDNVPAAIRRQMVERHIGFIAPGAQIYVPDILLDLRERTPAVPTGPGEHISPTTQLVLIAVLLGHPLEDCNLTQLAARFEVAVMSMTRAVDELEALQVAKARLVGRQRRLHMVASGRELWEAVADRLQSPIRKIRTVRMLAPFEAPFSGESALAHFTMLASPRVSSRAVAAARWKMIEKDHLTEMATALDGDRIELETWSYAPHILARDGVVDPLSLFLSVRHNRDERVEQAAHELLESLEW